MFPLYQDINRTKLIADRSKKHTANLFGLIAYTDANPNVKKVIKDTAWWDCFDSISTGWIIYAIRPEEGQRVRYTEQNEESCGIDICSELNYDFLHDFGVTSVDEFPMFIVLCLSRDDNIQSIRIPIDDQSFDIATNSIRSIIRTVTKVLNRINIEYRSSTNVFREVDKEFQSIYARVSINKASSSLKLFIKDLFSVLGMYFSISSI